jgi:hypothetical protein
LVERESEFDARGLNAALVEDWSNQYSAEAGRIQAPWPEKKILLTATPRNG